MRAMSTPRNNESDHAVAQRPNYVLHVGLFAATCTTTYMFGGLAFAATLMTILFVHEMGHYITARIHNIDASPPYFIPLPPQVTLGTLGAVIRMRRSIDDRNKLLDVGASGPLAGLVVAIPLLIVGLTKSSVGIAPPGTMVIEGNSLLYIGLKYLVTGLYLPAADGTDVQLHPMAFAAWVGLLITFINLIPIGQLDGGHVARAFLGNKHERLSRWLHMGLLGVGAVVATYLCVDAHTSGYTWGAAARYGAWGAAPWLVWSLMLLVLRRVSGGVYHPPVAGPPLSRGRRVLLVVTALVFVAIFTPIPLRQGL